MQKVKITMGAIFLSMTLTVGSQIGFMDSWGWESFYAGMRAQGVYIGEPATGSDVPENATWSNALRASGNLPWDGYSVSLSFEGDGSQEIPYLIQCPGDLKLLADRVSHGETMEGVFFRMTDDIDLNGKAWTSIGYDTERNDGTSVFAFRGEFDGRGHWVKGLYQRYSNAKSYVGLFAKVEQARICDLKVEGVVSGHDRVGGIVGEAGDSVLERCVSSVNVISSNIGGGLVGVVCRDSLVTDCTNNRYVRCGSSTGHSYAGGIAGLIDEGTVSDCLSRGDVTARDSAGGIAGALLSGAVYNCEIPYLSASAPAIGGQNEYNQNLYPDDTGGIVGLVIQGEVKNCRFSGVIRYSLLESKLAGLYVGRVENGNLGDQFKFLYCQKGKEGIKPFGQGPNDRVRPEHYIGVFDGNRVKLWDSEKGLCRELEPLLFQVLEEGVLDIGEERLHHFAPDRLGNPSRGYYLHVPGVENGELSARQVNDYAYAIDSRHPGAVSAGAKVSVTTRPRDIEEDLETGVEAVHFTLVPDSLVLTVLEERQRQEPVRELGFVMPKEDAVLTASYTARVSGMEFGNRTLLFEIVEERTGEVGNPIVRRNVTAPQSVNPVIHPSRADEKALLWKNETPDLFSVDREGNVTVDQEAEWIGVFLEENGLKAGHLVSGVRRPWDAAVAAANPVIVEYLQNGVVTASTEDGGYSDGATVQVRYRLVDKCYERRQGSGSGGGSGGGGSLSGAATKDTLQTPGGSWRQDKEGWWYQDPDGGYPRDQWRYLESGPGTDWYFFDSAGYMEDGWLNREGRWYYLHPVSDGRRGHMYTGWHFIEGVWYYFKPEAGPDQGSWVEERKYSVDGA